MVWMMTIDRRKDKRRAEDARRDEDLVKRYEFLLQNTRDIILTIRYEDRKILDANDAALKTYQYTIDELRSMTIDDLRTDDLQSQINPHMDMAVSHGILFETTHVKKNGETFPVEVSSQETMMGNERVLLSIVRDISERKQFCRKLWKVKAICARF